MLSLKRDIVSAGGSFGGRLADLWSYDLVGNVWSQLSPSGAAPAARLSHVAALDAERGRLLLHGGYGGDQPVDEEERKRSDGRRVACTRYDNAPRGHEGASAGFTYHEGFERVCLA